MALLQDVTEEIFSLFERHSNHLYIGEAITSTEHSIQAAMLAEADNQPTYVVLAALLHDIGHFIGVKDGLNQMRSNETVIGTERHEQIAAQYLREKGFPECLVRLVEEHVNAKRYRVTVDSSYVLSPASAQTLVWQGGKMSAEEVQSYQKRGDLELVLKVREYDERAKDPSIKCKALGYYKIMCQEFLNSQQATSQKQVELVDVNI